MAVEPAFIAELPAIHAGALPTDNNQRSVGRAAFERWVMAAIRLSSAVRCAKAETTALPRHDELLARLPIIS